MSDNRVSDDGLTQDDNVSTRPAFYFMMKFERNRLDSFKSWPANAPIEAKKLAKAGFFYMGKDFLVKCFSCKRTIDKWDFGDHAIQKHSAVNSNCDFVLHKSDNIPMQEQRNNLYTPPSTRQEINSRTTNTTLPSTPSNPPHLQIQSSAAQNLDDKTWKSFETLLSEEERLKTFKGWPLSFIKPEDLARNGFFYLRDGDKVQCFFCRGVVGQWEDGDNPAVEHRKHFRRCPFMSGYNVGNKPSHRAPDDEGIEASTTPPDETWGGDVTGRYNYEMDVFSRPERGMATSAKLSQFKIIRPKAPRHPNYTTYRSRLRTYDTWPKAISLKPWNLAEAGFYYAGVSDHVRCYSCDGGLRNWEANDDPWVEHARWFGECYYLTLMKGHEFAEEAKMQPQPVHPGRSSSEIQTQTLVNAFMTSPIVKVALETGLDCEIIRRVIAKKIEVTGTAFDDGDALTEAYINFLHSSCISKNKVILPSSLSSEKSISASNQCLASSELKSASESRDISVEDENRQLKEEKLCKICMDEEIGVAFLPCGHLICCPKCASSLGVCALCRKEIYGILRTFNS